MLPSRNARHGLLYTRHGIVSIKSAKWKDDFTPIDAESPAESSRFYTKAYLRHLFHCGELLAMQIATLQNLSFYLWLVGEARRHILLGDFSVWKAEMVERVQRRL